MVTLAGTQNLSEFELHARAVLNLPIPEITLLQCGASAVILASEESNEFHYEGIQNAIAEPKTDIKIFGKPTTRKYRRMGVTLAYDEPNTDVQQVKQKAINNAAKVRVVNGK